MPKPSQSPMMQNKYMQLLFENRAVKNREFKAQKNVKGENEILLYDVIVSSKEEAEWWGGVDPETFRDALNGFNGEDVSLRINSPGGSVFGGRAMQNALAEYPGKVTAYIDGIAASAASFVPMGAKNIYMGEGAMMMIHKGWTFAVGNADDLRDQAGVLDKIDNSLVKTYAKHNRVGLAENKIMDFIKAETWFDESEAIEHGFADALPGENDVNNSGLNNSQNNGVIAWNLEVFKNEVTRPENVESEEEETENLISDDHRNRQNQRLNLINATAGAQ